MHSIRDLRRRIRSISSTAQITKAMQMVAASKMRKAQQAALAGRPFAYLLYRIQREATTRMGEFSHPLLEKRFWRRSSFTPGIRRKELDARALQSRLLYRHIGPWVFDAIRPSAARARRANILRGNGKFLGVDRLHRGRAA